MTRSQVWIVAGISYFLYVLQTGMLILPIYIVPLWGLSFLCGLVFLKLVQKLTS